MREWSRPEFSSQFLPCRTWGGTLPLGRARASKVLPHDEGLLHSLRRLPQPGRSTVRESGPHNHPAASVAAHGVEARHRVGPHVNLIEHALVGGEGLGMFHVDFPVLE